MIGREAYQNPSFLLDVDRCLFGLDQNRPMEIEPTPETDLAIASASIEKSMEQKLNIAEAMVPYIEAQLKLGTPLHSITRHMLGLFNQAPGARSFRRLLSEGSYRKGAGLEIWLNALKCIKKPQVDDNLDRQALAPSLK